MNPDLAVSFVREDLLGETAAGTMPGWMFANHTA